MGPGSSSEGESGVEVEVECAIGIHVTVGQWCECTSVDFVESNLLIGFIEYFLDHERVHLHQCCLEQVQTEGCEFLVISSVGGEVAVVAVANEPVR